MGLLDRFKKEVEESKKQLDICSKEREEKAAVAVKANKEFSRVQKIDQGLKDLFLNKVIGGKKIENVFLSEIDGVEVAVFDLKVIPVEEYSRSTFDKLVVDGDFNTGLIALYNGKSDRKEINSLFQQFVVEDKVAVIPDYRLSARKVLTVGNVHNAIAGYGNSGNRVEVNFINKMIVDNLGLNLTVFFRVSNQFANDEIVKKAFDRLVEFSTVEVNKYSGEKSYWLSILSDKDKDKILDTMSGFADNVVEDLLNGRLIED